ncbi:MAG: hypothetical protein M3409_08815 [Gemmatimonadota bacterium]|nr:hypothetical protein [Gemmatimonadota bacterium]
MLAGDTDGAVFLTEAGCTGVAERVADLFALADLLPGRWIEELRAGGVARRGVRAEIAVAITGYAERWTAERLRDRAGFRLRLFRERAV